MYTESCNDMTDVIIVNYGLFLASCNDMADVGRVN